jgi:CHASE2 domain-containing sensor protein
VGAAVLACVAIYAVESLVESRLESGPRGQSPLTRSVFELSRLYQAAVTVGSRKPQPRFTVILELNADRDAELQPVSVNMVCAQRGFLADLVKGITEWSPAVIVLDKYFSPDLCNEGAEDPARTAHLKTAILAARAARVPFVVGLAVTLQKGAIQPRASLFDGESQVSQGIVNIDRDTRRMALRWCGSDATTGRTIPAWCETLALQAARAYDPQIMVKYPRLLGLLVTEHHPYIGFMRPEQFCRFAVTRPFGLKPVKPPEGSPQVCPEDPRAFLEYLHGKIVVVGETSAGIDTHVSVVGPVSGLYMQANYIEALLDARYFRPAPWLDYTLGLVIFGVVMLVPVALHAHPRWALVFVGASLVATMGLVLWLILLGGLYVNPVGVGVLALLFDGSHVGLSWLLRKVGAAE